MLGARQAGKTLAKIVNTFLKAECGLARVQNFWEQYTPEEFRRLLLTDITTQERLGVERERREKASFTVEAWRRVVAISRKDQSSALGTSTLSQLQKKALSHLGKKRQNLGHRTRSSTAGGSEEKKPYPVSMRWDKKRRVSKVYSPYC